MILTVIKHNHINVITSGFALTSLSGNVQTRDQLTC